MHVRGVTRWEGGILNYELVVSECFPFDIIGETPAWPRKFGMGNMWFKGAVM